MLLLIGMILILILIGIHNYLHSCYRYEKMQGKFPDKDFENYFRFFKRLDKEINYWKIWQIRKDKIWR